MLVELTTLKTRLGITSSGDDAALTRTIQAVGAEFDGYCNRHLERSESAEQLFSADDREISLLWYPVESISSIQTRTSRRSAWVRESVDYEIRYGCVLYLQSSIGDETEQARVMYIGGYVPPGTTADDGQTALPKDIEQSALDQAAFWYESRHSLRVADLNARGNTQRASGDLTLLPHVTEILDRYRRLAL